MYKQVLNYKFRLYPNKLYEQRLESNLEACRFLYNHFIEYGYTDEYEMNRRITELKDAYLELNNYHAKMLQMVSKQVANIFKSLRALKKNGYKVSNPRLKLVQKKLSRKILITTIKQREYMIIQERIHRKRLDFLHKLSKGYANKYDIITEELNTMLENKPSDTNKKRIIHCIGIYRNQHLSL